MASGLLSWLVPALLLGAAVAPGNASPIAGAVVGNGTADGLLDIDGFGDGSLAKRAMPGAASDEVVRKYEQLGHTQVSEWLFATSADATANLIGPVVKEVFNLNGDPLKHNWQRHLVTRKEEVLIKDWGINDISGTAVSAASDPVNMLDKLTVGRQPTSPAQQLEKWQEERKAQSGLYPRGPNVRYQVHQQTAIPAYYGHQQPFVMGAGYDVTLNIVDGIIIVDEARGPTRRDDGFRIPFNRFPDITSWSEVVFDLWLRIKPVKRPRQSVMTVAPNHGKLNPFSTFEPGLKVKEFLGVEGFLNYVFMVNIREPTEEVSIIKRCLASRTDANQYPGYDDAQRFSVGHWCYYALLASEHGEAIAWLLTTHKGAGTVKIARMGNKVLKSVTVFATDPCPADGQQSHPTLMWEIVDQDPKWVKLRDDMQKLWLAPGTADNK